MADDVDLANELAAMHIDMAIRNHAETSKRVQLMPDGLCHYCADDVGPLRLFCDSTCATLYEPYLK